LDFQYAVLKVF